MVMMFVAVNVGGFYKCAALHARFDKHKFLVKMHVFRQHAHVVIAAIQFTKCLALFSAPAVVAFFVETESNREEWIPVFVSLGVSMFIVSSMLKFKFKSNYYPGKRNISFYIHGPASILDRTRKSHIY